MINIFTNSLVPIFVGLLLGYAVDGLIDLLSNDAEIATIFDRTAFWPDEETKPR